MSQRLIDKRLQFFTGKGGVGKSTVTAALALLAARKGKKVLIVEIDTNSTMRRIFNAPFVGFVPLEVRDGIYVININPEEALAEYIQEHVKIQRVARKISQNSILQYFFKAAPAVNELVAINKIFTLFKQRDETNMLEYDLVLVDLPATGHAISFLGLPVLLGQLVGVGPIRKMIEKYQTLFTDSQTTAVNLVTLAEEMPVAETIELYQAISKKLTLPMGNLFVNAVVEQVFDESEVAAMKKLEAVAGNLEALDAALLPARYSMKQQQRSETLIHTLVDQVRMNLITLPRLLVGHFDMTALKQLTNALHGETAEETA